MGVRADICCTWHVAKHRWKALILKGPKEPPHVGACALDLPPAMPTHGVGNALLGRAVGLAVLLDQQRYELVARDVLQACVWRRMQTSAAWGMLRNTAGKPSSNLGSLVNEIWQQKCVNHVRDNNYRFRPADD